MHADHSEWETLPVFPSHFNSKTCRNPALPCFDGLMVTNTLLLRRIREANFAKIIKVLPIFIKKTFKDSQKVKRIGYYALKRNLYMYFSIKQKLLITGEKMLMSAELKRCVR